MEHVKALAIKGIMTIVILYLVLGLGFSFSFENTLFITIVLGAVSYLLGDLFILPKTNNITATLADLGVAFLVVWLMALAMGTAANTAALAAFFAAVAMAIGEYIFHFYLMNKGLGSPNRRMETRTE
ncbi:DUF2512 family protein [Bacillus licheniformis]|jgi:hypothetical protein|uniref:DUF2512 family protein n=5 Tax=Bacillus TaxID=1386 RepID=Q65NZ0_BACLD|nr:MULTISPECIES: DUF2512 family protein [Bacillus]KJD55923.1 membrane protein [Bacillus amyloliquefaciens]KUL09269.1 membrane protein [Bacillus licheniformis LMG 7559]KUL18685.1 membrane protein [Bacillus licheniformis LMG 6934]MBJ7885226.1 DUF2512 family protein [Bacillaceae bacterium HSR45]MBY8348884.1 DUF2512 family protein [Bacillus sp. PCH94]MDP4080942.1 DUF2512 family protein [Bacillota bacterium]